MRIEQRMPGFEGVAPGNTALVKLPIGRRYHHLYLDFTGVTLAQMTEIRLIANGKVFQRFSATERNLMNKFIGLADATQVLQLPLDRIGLKNRDQEEVTAVNTGVADARGNKISSFTVEIDLAAGAYTPALKMYATQSEPLPGGPGLMLNIVKDSRSPAGAGKFEISDFSKNTPVHQMLNRVFFKPSTGSISSVEIERDLYNIWERSAVLNSKIQTDAGRVPQAEFFTVDTTELGYGANGIGTAPVNDFRYRLDVSEAMTVTAIQEYIGILGQ